MVFLTMSINYFFAYMLLADRLLCFTFVDVNNVNICLI